MGVPPAIRPPPAMTLNGRPGEMGSDFRRGDRLQELEMFSPSRPSRQLRRLLDLGLIKRVRRTYRYYLTKAGRAATAAAGRLTQAVIIPAMI